jgi:hypothetical protein
VAEEFESFTLSDPPPASTQIAADDTGVPSSLEDAVMREISGRAAGRATSRPSYPQSIIEPSQLRPRPSSNPPMDPDETADPLPSVPPDAVIPDEEGGAVEPAPPLHTKTPESLPRVVSAAPSRTDVEEPSPVSVTPITLVAPDSVPVTPEPERVAFPPRAIRSPVPPPPGSDGLPPQVTPPTPPTAPLPLVTVRAAQRASIRPDPRPTQFDSVSTPEEAEIPRRRSWWLPLLLLGVVAAAVAVGLRLNPRPLPEAPRAATSLPAVPPSASASALAAVPLVHLRELPLGTEVGRGEGLLEIAAPPEAPVRVENEVRGRGPRVAISLPPGFYNVRVGATGRDQTSLVEVRAGRATSVDFTKGL